MDNHNKRLGQPTLQVQYNHHQQQLEGIKKTSNNTFGGGCKCDALHYGKR